MKSPLVILFLFSMAFSAAQPVAVKDTLAKYSILELLEKTYDATRHNSSTRALYFEKFFSRNPTDSLKSEAYYNLAFNYYEFTDYGIDYSISLLRQSLKYEKELGNIHNQIVTLDGLCLFYAMKNENEKVLASLREMKKLMDLKSLPEYQHLKIQSVPYRIYAFIGDFKRAASGYQETIQDIEGYIAEHPNMPKDRLTGLIYDIRSNYAHLISIYNYQKNLDLAAFCIKKVKELNARGFIGNGIWYQETVYLILKGKPDLGIAKVAASDDLYIKNSKSETYKSLYCLALCYQQKEDYQKALAFCEKALQINIRVFSFINYELEFYRIAADSAKKLGDFEKADGYSERYLEALQKFDYTKKADFISKLYEQDVIAPLDEKLKEEKRNGSYFFYGSSLLLIGLCCLIAWSVKSRKEKKKFLEIIAKLEQKEFVELEKSKIQATAAFDKAGETKVTELQEDRDGIKGMLHISNETEKKILKQLTGFEKKQQFLSPNITSGSLAADFNTNVVYLSGIIKKYKMNNFNGYINELRIDYIISKLKSNPEYSAYKIAYLAEECGFTSHSTFIRVFTQQKGIPPSKFISYLNRI